MPLIRKGEPQTPAGGARPDAFAALTDPSPDVRWSATRALSGEPGGVAALGKALPGETDARVREAMLTALARAATPEAVDAIIPALGSDDAGLRTAALDALQTMPRMVAPRLAALLNDPDADVRLLSCEIGRALPVAEASLLLCALLDRETEVNVCAAAVEVLAETGGPEALPALERCAARFAHEPFLGFAIKIAVQRIGGQ